MKTPKINPCLNQSRFSFHINSDNLFISEICKNMAVVSTAVVVYFLKPTVDHWPAACAVFDL